VSPSLLQRLAHRAPFLRRRAALLRALRDYFHEGGFTEVETPLLLTTVAPEEHIAPMLVGERYLATSPELQMKQLVAAGLEPLYQIGRSFRSGEKGRLHNPEFTMLEWYRAGADIVHLVSDIDGLLGYLAAALLDGPQLIWQGRTVDLSVPCLVTPVREAFVRHAGWDPVAAFDGDRFNLDLANLVEPQLGRGRPEVLAWYPAEVGSLSRAHPEDSRLSQRMELYFEGMELANGFVELNDPVEQRRRFAAEQDAIRAAGREPPPMPESYLKTLSALPDTVGIALGIDRLTMLFADAGDIAQVRAFSPDEA
jgi:elongation factor P--(R)-beta-lysine ligase